jgi:hypothetical protein
VARRQQCHRHAPRLSISSDFGSFPSSIDGAQTLLRNALEIAGQQARRSVAGFAVGIDLGKKKSLQGAGGQ